MEKNEKVYVFIYWLTIAITIFLIGALVITSIIVRDTAYMVKHPLKFTIETVGIAVLTSVTIFILGWSRDIHMKRQLFMVLGLMLKVALINVLLQISGFYTVAFPQLVL